MNILQTMIDDVLDPIVGQMDIGNMTDRGGLNDVYGNMQLDQSVSTTIRPRMDVIETPENFSFLFDLPGITNKEEINLTLDNNVLHIDCKKPQVCTFHHTAEERRNLNYHRHERKWGNFDRSVRVPATLDLSKVSSSYKTNGVLIVTVEKLPQEKGSNSASRKLQIL